jgi:FHA domain-containing protein
MRLLVHARSTQDSSLSQPLTCEFDERGGTIGRSDANTLSLPDPERHVSRLQAEVLWREGAFAVRNVGNANPLMLNGQSIASGQTAALHDGDELVLGRYTLQLSLRDSPATAGAARMLPSDIATVIRASATEARTGTRAAKLPEDFDPFADLVARPASAPNPSLDDAFALLLPAAPAGRSSSVGDAMVAAREAPAKGKDDAWISLTGSTAATPSLDDVFGLSTQTPSLDEVLPLPNAARGAAGLDPLGLGLGSAPRGHTVIGPSASNHVPELNAAYAPPRVMVEESTRVVGNAPRAIGNTPPRAIGDAPHRAIGNAPPHAIQAAPPRASPAASAAPGAVAARTSHAPASDVGASPGDTAALWAAFREGAGLPASGTHAQATSPDTFRQAGALLREAVDGIVQLMKLRADAKHELRAAVTTIQTHANNPLKFSPDAVAALEQLLAPPLRGFMPAAQAMRDATADLTGHSVGTLAGTQAALQHLLLRFEPTQLERQLASGGILDMMLPMHRQARLWELYLEHHQRIRDAARDDFHAVFGKAFVEAYEAQSQSVADAQRAS